MNALPTAVYHVLLRGGVSFADVRAMLPYLADLGISHLYLSPIFTAANGSTHGYDVANPSEIDPSLGGEAGFLALARAAQARGLGIILDIVPNHTVFGPDNLWLRDVLTFGRASRYDPHFDIDWSKGPVLLPFLPDSFDACAQAGTLGISPGLSGNGVMQFEGGDLPLAPGTWDGRVGADPALLADVHQRQFWRLAKGGVRAPIRHRRFFNVTELIGMRVDDPAVFDDTHAALFRLIEAGAVQGIRVDHVDGLVDPGAYLDRLRSRAGDVPIWVEKILTGDERLPDWQTEGTTGYEAGRTIAQVLTDPEGMARLDTLWRADGGAPSFDDVLTQAKLGVLGKELAQEVRHLQILARQALSGSRADAVTDEDLMAALRALLVASHRYRTYLTDGPRRAEDLTVLAKMQTEARSDTPQQATAIDLLVAILKAPDTPEGRAFTVRFEQVTGALLAKSQEDTAGYRYARMLGACEVGAEPGDPLLSPARFGQRAAAHPSSAWVLTSSHDTKRSGDARMRMIAATHRPEDFARLLEASKALETAAPLPAPVIWYVIQSMLALWGQDDFATRLEDHMQKALREAKDQTTWDKPDEAFEEVVSAFAAEVSEQWAASPEGVEPLIRQAEVLGLAQTALALTVPGIPYIFQGCETASFTVTDPDNRRPVDFKALSEGRFGDTYASRKADLTRCLLALRRDNPGFFRDADCSVRELPDGHWHLQRRLGARVLTVRVMLDGWVEDHHAVWPKDGLPAGVAVRWTEDAPMI